MKRILLLLGFLAAALSGAAQNNAYSIDDSCYVYFMEAERTLVAPEFKKISEKLLSRALECGDKKAETIYYVEYLKNISRSAKGLKLTDKALDERLDEAHRKVLEVSREYGYMQYYYYSYELSQSYYYNHNKFEKMRQLIQEMQETAIQDHDDYGLWTSYRYLSGLYVSLNDYATGVQYIRKALYIYDHTNNEYLKRQSVCRMYCDVADSFPIGDDSVRFYIDKAVQTARVKVDTLRCAYHQAKLNAYYKDIKAYRGHRDYCLASPRLDEISPSARDMFSVIDNIVERSVSRETVEKAISISRIREVKFIANIAEAYGFKEDAFVIEKALVKRLEIYISQVNDSKLAEMDVQLEKNVLNADLQEKNARVQWFSNLLTILVVLIMGGVLLVVFIHMRNLQKIRVKDELRIAELQEANEKVRLADAAKTRFVQNMSHEVRTPLNAIVGFSQLLALPDGSFSPEEKDEFSGHIINNTKMLTMLLDDILNASAMDSGKYKITYEEGEVHFMAQSAISSAEHRLQPGVRMYYAPGSEEPFSFVTDPRRVQQILINLLTNACKHTTQGEIRLSSSLDEDPGYVTYAVTDTGPGVPADQAEKIFERFAKLNDFVQGTGLGLSICRDIASRMGAKVYLDTTYTGGGARFVFSVPIKPESPQL